MNFKITNGSVSYGADTIIENINFEVKGKEKVAIVGRNGCGKSTLLKAIIDNSLLSEGTSEEKFSIFKEGIYNIGYLRQIDFDDESITMKEEILKVYSDIINIENKINLLLEKMQSDKSEALAKEYSRLQDRFEFLNGYTYKKEYETVVRKFGFSVEDLDKKISEFSGGQRTKIAFIKLLLSKPDLLLLDEPTNHLDIDTIEWLEGYLKTYPKACIIVSHDRMFINKIVDKVYEIEYGEMTLYSGNYDYYEKQKRVNYEKQLKDYEYQQKEIKRLMAVVERFRYKKNKAKMAQAKLKQIERMAKLEEPNKYDLKTFKSNFKISRQSGKNVLNISNLSIGYEKSIVANINFDLYKGQKIGIIGPNGTGKSTLLKTIVSKIEKISGEINIGHNVDIGYFDQKEALVDSEKTVYDVFSNAFPNLTVTEIRNSLAAFIFYGDDVFKEVKMLSGGEKVRLKLSMILKNGPNLLILDEPTNHMDIIGKETLENMLKEYEGSILFVSHDRFFVNKIADSIIVFEKGNDTKNYDNKNDENILNTKVKYYNCTYEEYLEIYKEKEEIQSSNNLNISHLRENDIQVKKEKNIINNPLKEKSRIERKIRKVEEDIQLLENVISDNKKLLEDDEISSDYIKLEEINNKINEQNESLNLKYLEWENLQKELEEFNNIN